MMKSSISKFWPVLFIGFLLWFASSCKGNSQDPLATSTPEIFASLSSTDTPNPTVIPNETSTPSPSSTLTPNPYPHMIAEIGRGLIDEYIISPDGSMIAYYQDMEIYWADSQTGDLLGSFDMEYDLYFFELDFSPDNNWIVIRTYAETRLIDTKTGESIPCCKVEASFNSDFRFSNDMNYLAFIVNNGSMLTPNVRHHRVGVYSIETGEVIVSDHPSDLVTYIDGDPALDPENKMIAAGDVEDGSYFLVVWDLPSGKIRYKFQYSLEINTVDFSPDGKYLAVGTDDGYIRLHDPETGEWLSSIRGFPGAIKEMRFTDDSSAIEVSFRDYPKHIYNLATEKIEVEDLEEKPIALGIMKLHQAGWADGSKVQFSPVENVVAIGGNTIQLWDIETNKLLVSLENPIISKNTRYDYLHGWTFSPTGDKIAGITTAEDGMVLVWDTKTGELLYQIQGFGVDITHHYYGKTIAFTPDGTKLAFRILTSFVIWDFESGEIVFKEPSPIGTAYNAMVSFSADGNYLYTVLRGDGLAYLWDVHTGELLYQVDFSKQPYGTWATQDLFQNYFTRFNSDSTGFDWIEVWNLDTGELEKYPVRSWQTDHIQFSPDGRILMALSIGTLYIWDTQTGTLLKTINDLDFDSISINIDNSLFALGKDGIAQIWDISSLTASLGE